MIHKSKIPIYYGELHVVITEDFTKYGCFNKSVNDYKAIATCVNEGKSHWSIFINPKYIDEHSVIAHESLHVVGYIFASIKCKMDLDNDEPQCYLLGWVVDEVYKAISKYKNVLKLKQEKNGKATKTNSVDSKK